MQVLFDKLRLTWRKLPLPLPLRQCFHNRFVKKGGLLYALSYLCEFYRRHNHAKFAGNLLTLKEEYQSNIVAQQVLSQRFVEIVDNLVLQNGVRKTTQFKRHKTILSTIFGAGTLNFKSESIRVLDVPSSIGIASLDTYDFLSRQYKISSYVLGDICFEVLFDRDRECIFDDGGNLLQVRQNGHFFSIYRPHSSGNLYSVLAKGMLAPLAFKAWRAKRKFSFMPGRHNIPILLLHPEVVDRVRQGIFRWEKLDVFSKIEGQFDLILSFNLLQKNYFSQERINIGIENLKNALSENGLIITGNDDYFCVWKKMGGELVLLEKNGDF